MKSSSIVFVLMIVSTQLTNAQNEITTSVRASNFTYRLQNLGGQLRSGDMISGFSSYSAPNVIGDVYWDKHWGQSSILLSTNTEALEGYLTRYDIYKNEFEFNTSSGVKVLRGSQVKDIIWIDSISGKQRILVNAKGFAKGEVQISGFLELLVEGKHSLYKNLYLEVLKPDFNPALNVGSKDARILKKESYYFNYGESLIRIKSKKSLEALGPGYEQQVNQFMKTNNTKLNNEGDLIRLFQSLAGI